MKRIMSGMVVALAASLAFAGALSAEEMSADERMVELTDLDVGDGAAKMVYDKLWLSDQLVHDPGDGTLPLRLHIKYTVLDTAPVLLNSRFGTEYWWFMNYTQLERTPLHTTEDVDLSKAGEAVASVSEAEFKDGARPQKGLAGLRGHYFLLIDQPNREWLGIYRPPPFLDYSDAIGDLVFTLANLESFELDVAAHESDWQPGATLRVKLRVTDADGEQFPVVNVQGMIKGGDWNAPLTTQLDSVKRPTGWMLCTLPEAEIPDELTLTASVSAMTPDGPVQRDVTATLTRAEAAAPPPNAGEAEVALPRNEEGVIRETRALWVHPNAIANYAGIRTLMEQVRATRLNALLVDVYVRSNLFTNSAVYPGSRAPQDIGDEFDGLATLIERAHEAGVEVHPWFCISYVTPEAIAEAAPGVEMINRNGEPIAHRVDLHRPAYRDFVVRLMADIAKNYDVDGIHLDYIRTQGTCYCEDCRREFKARFDTPLEEATGEQLAEWHTDAVSDIVRRTAEAVREARPDAIISTAGSDAPEQGRMPTLWVKEGWVGAMISMSYTLDPLYLWMVVRDATETLGAGEDAFVAGLSLYKRVKNTPVSRDAELVRQQIGQVRRSGVHGYCLFVDRWFSDEIIRMLGEVNSEAAVPYYRKK